MTMFAQIGNHIFQGLKAPASSSESDSVKYGQIPRINNKPVTQPTGAELREVKLSIQYSVDFCDPAVEIDSLKKSMHSNEVLPYITGEGRIVGKFVIVSIETASLRCAADGRIEIAVVNLSLLESPGGLDPKPLGQALTSQKPIVEPPANPLVTAATGITEDLDDGKNKINGMKQVIKSVKGRTTSLKRGVREVRQLATDAEMLYSTAKTKVAATKKIVKRAGQLPTSIGEAIKYAENLAKMDNVADISVLEMNVNKLAASADKVTSDAAPIAGFVGTKEGGI